MNHEIEFVNEPSQDLVDFFDKKIEEFNLARWEVKTKEKYAFKVHNDQGEIVAGAAGWSFGYWLFLANLWVSEELRGQKMGLKILKEIEELGAKRGCKYVMLDTLNFQARPFYEKYGYEVKWTQENYPKEGCKYYMVKELWA